MSWSTRKFRPFGTYSPLNQEGFHSQLDDPVTARYISSKKLTDLSPQTLTEKIVQQHAVNLPNSKNVKSGDYVSIRPHHCMTHDNSWPVASKFLSIGASQVHDPRQLVMTLDHDVQNKSEQNLRKYRRIEDFAREQGVDFYPAGRGIGHQIMVEEGYAWPGTLVVASDSHSNMYGGIACLGTPVVRTDAASIWATGTTWWQIPPIAKVLLFGTLPKGVTGKDVIVALCGLFQNDQVLNHAIEFAGSEETLRSLPIDDRLAISNMSTEWGALSALFPIDLMLRSWLRSKATEAALFKNSQLSSGGTHHRFAHSRIDSLLTNPLTSDPGARYAKRLFLDLSTLSPYVSGPNSVKIASPLRDLERQNIRVDKAYLVSCTNSRASDIAAAAKVFKEAAEKSSDRKIPQIPQHVKFFIAAASALEQQAAEEQGDWQVLLSAGAHPLPSGCGPCIGLGTGLLEPGEVGISASNRNFKGRMGSTKAKAYLASPEVVAASALNGRISGPGWYRQSENANKVMYGESTTGDSKDQVLSVEDALEKVISQVDSIVEKAEKNLSDELGKPAIEDKSMDARTDIIDGFPEKLSGEIVWCSADNVNTDAIYPGKYTYEDNVSKEDMAKVVMENYDPRFAQLAKAGDVLVSGYNFGCGSSREQAATAILAKGIRLVMSGSFGNIFARNSINNALIGIEVPALVGRLREVFDSSASPVLEPQIAIKEPSRNSQSLDSPPPGPMTTNESVQPAQEKHTLTRRTGWTLEWDVRRSVINVKEGENGKSWSQKVEEIPPNVQEIIALGGLEAWVKQKIS